MNFCVFASSDFFCAKNICFVLAPFANNSNRAIIVSVLAVRDPRIPGTRLIRRYYHGRFENFENQLKANPKTIVFTEGTDARILSAASKLLAGKILNVLLLGNPEAVKKAAAEGGFDITGAEICDPTSYPEFDAMVAKMVELRKGKMTEEQCPSPTTSAPCGQDG